MDRRTFLIAAASSALPLNGARADRVRLAVSLMLPLSGPEAALGRSMRDAALAAVEQLNGSAEGRRPPLTVQVVDTRSDPRRFLGALSRQMWDAKAINLFGICPPAARAEMRHLLEQTDSVFWDPSPSEGGECSRNIVHGGPTPHQSLKHVVPWIAAQAGRRFLLVGTDQPWPAELVRVCREMIRDIGAVAVGPPELVPPGHADFTAVLDRIRRERAEVVFSALTGESAVAFLRQFKARGFDHGEIPVVSPALDELTIAALPPGTAAGAIAAQPYFAGYTSPANTLFLQRLRRRSTAPAPAHAQAEAAWFQLRMFGAALDLLGDGAIASPINIREAAKPCTIDAPQGPVRIESDTLYTALWPKIAVVEPSGRFRVLARSDQPVRPLPYWGWPGKVCTEAGVVG